MEVVCGSSLMCVSRRRKGLARRSRVSAHLGIRRAGLDRKPCHSRRITTLSGAIFSRCGSGRPGPQGCEVVEAMPASAYVTQGWADYGNYLLENSPAMDHVVNQHPLWWGHLSSIRWGRK